MSRTTFIDSLVSVYQDKRTDLYYAEVTVVQDANKKRLEAYTSTPEWLSFIETATKLVGEDRVSFFDVHDYRGWYGDDEFKTIVGLQNQPPRYHNDTLDTLLVGALTTTQVRYWDGLFEPVSAYLDAVEKATTNEELDEAAMALVKALAD